MDVGRSLLEGCLAHPDDDALRLVYADWLEEQGDPIAELIRAQLAGEPIDDLIDQHFMDWLKPVYHWVLPPYFARGMFAGVLLRPALPDGLAPLFAGLARFGSAQISLEFPGDVSTCEALAWTPKLVWDDPDDESLATLAASPYPRFVREIVLREGRSTFSDQAVAQVRSNPALARLEHVVVHRAQR